MDNTTLLQSYGTLQLLPGAFLSIVRCKKQKEHYRNEVYTKYTWYRYVSTCE